MISILFLVHLQSMLFYSDFIVIVLIHNYMICILIATYIMFYQTILCHISTLIICFCLKVKIEMLKERVVALKEQEEKLGAMVAALQVAKAREVSMPPPPTKVTPHPTVLPINKVKGQYIPHPHPQIPRSIKVNKYKGQ